MPHYQQLIQIPTKGKALHSITSSVQSVVTNSGIHTGLCNLFLRHTSASLLIQENADPDALADFTRVFAKLVPDRHAFSHNGEGLDDVPAHIYTALTHTSEQIPVMDGKLALGGWQSIYVWEHRRQGLTRELVVHVMGDA